jgi:outer membrane protein assembly factor BamB
MRHQKAAQRISLHRNCLVAAVAGSFLAFCHAVLAADWPQFLGPERTGISKETGLIDKLADGGPKEVWRVEGGVGMSGMAIAGGRLVTMWQGEGKDWVVALDAASGKTLWKTEIAPAYKNSMGDGPRATPTIAGETVVAFTGDGILAALKVKDGSLLWKKDVVAQFEGKPADYGMACSPLVVGGQVIVTAGAPGACVVSYKLAYGELNWKSGDDRAGYSSPNILKVGGREQLVVFTGQSAIGLAPATGKVLWRYEYETDFDCNIATPLAFKDQVFISSGENHGSTLLALRGKGESYTVEPVWKSQGGGSVLRNEWQTSILLEGYLYGFDNVGSAGPVTHLTCVEAATGKRMWQQLRFGKGNLIAADGKLFIVTMKGEVVLVRATPRGYEELDRAKVIGSTRQAPALSDGRLYLRDDREVVCLDVRAK